MLLDQAGQLTPDNARCKPAQHVIYVVDGRNGLDILRYTGPYEEEIEGAGFLEGNSNL